MRLRAHHLICLHFFRGEGYTDEYVQNLKRIIEEVKHEKIEIVMGADEVCKPCPFLRNDICVKGEEQIAELDFLAMKLLDVKPGDETEWEHSERKLDEILGVWKRYACFDCEYTGVCSMDERWRRA